jgi:putative transposase
LPAVRQGYRKGDVLKLLQKALNARGGHGTLVKLEVTRPVGGADAMTRKQGRTSVIDVKALLEADGDHLRAMVQAIVQATLEAEMTATLGAE